MPEVPAGGDVSVCRGCGAEIRWALTEAGRRIPLDAVPDPAGNIELVKAGARVIGPPGMLPDDRVRWMPHHATCPNVSDFRTADGRG